MGTQQSTSGSPGASAHPSDIITVTPDMKVKKLEGANVEFTVGGETFEGTMQPDGRIIRGQRVKPSSRIIRGA